MGLGGKTLVLAVLGAGLFGCGQDEDPTIRPTADAGFDQTVAIGATVTLSGTGSTGPSGSNLVYFWTLVTKPEGSTASLSSTSAVGPTLSTDLKGVYVVQLIVGSGGVTSLPDVVAIDAANSAPVARVECATSRIDCEVVHGDAAALDGRLSVDPDGGTLSYAWSQVTAAADCAEFCPELANCQPSAQAVSIGDSDRSLASFVAPDVKDTQLVFMLVISDSVETDAACLRYNTINNPPIILTASGPTSASSGADISLTSSAGDPDVDPLTYSWAQTAGPAATLPMNINLPNITIGAPTVGSPTPITMELTVTDGLDSDVETVTITINP